MRKLKHLLEYIFVLIVVKAVSLFKWQNLYSPAGLIAHLLRRILRRRENIASDNTEMTLSGESIDKQEVVFESFRNIVLTLFELIKLSKGERARDWVYFTDMNVFEDVYKYGRGCLLISAHLGNWELLAKRIVEMGFPVNVLVRRQSNAQVERLFREMRERCGVKVLYTTESAREIVQLLKRGEFVAILVDQDAGEGGQFYPFFGRDASWESGPALIASKLGSPVITGFDVRLNSGQHIAFIQEPIYLKKRDERAVDEFYGIYIERLERYIRLAPGQYHWLHDRWRTRPES